MADGRLAVGALVGFASSVIMDQALRASTRARAKHPNARRRNWRPEAP